jgi:uncharacterized protein (TIGR03083 family)
MSTPTTDAPVRAAQFDRAQAARLATDEYTRYLDLLRSLTPDQWRAPTECPAWDVFAMAGHCLGMAKYAASPEEAGRQQAAAFAAGGVFIDALTGLQVNDHAHLSPDDLAAAYADTWPKAAAGREQLPAEIRSSTMPQVINGETELWTIGYLADVILTRDLWMHRIDTVRAIGRSMQLSAEHDGALVADVVTEWLGRHGQPVSLMLDGPAGGTWSQGDDGPAYQLDAVEFCRILSGRASGDGLLATEVPF